jgi:hypothetical protein
MMVMDATAKDTPHTLCVVAMISESHPTDKPLCHSLVFWLQSKNGLDLAGMTYIRNKDSAEETVYHIFITRQMVVVTGCRG